MFFGTTAAMKIGDVLTYCGRRYVLLGVEPMSVPDRKGELRDAESGQIMTIPYALLVQSSERFGEDP
jgi:hypothetical protein